MGASVAKVFWSSALKTNGYYHLLCYEMGKIDKINECTCDVIADGFRPDYNPNFNTQSIQRKTTTTPKNYASLLFLLGVAKRERERERGKKIVTEE